jgi:hypothetical protein
LNIGEWKEKKRVRTTTKPFLNHTFFKFTNNFVNLNSFVQLYNKRITSSLKNCSFRFRHFLTHPKSYLLTNWRKSRDFFPFLLKWCQFRGRLSMIANKCFFLYLSLRCWSFHYFYFSSIICHDQPKSSLSMLRLRRGDCRGKILRQTFHFPHPLFQLINELVFITVCCIK